MSLFSILVDVAASSAQFQSEMKKVTDTLERVGDFAKSALEFTGVTLSLTELGESFVSAAEKGEQMVQMATRMGTTVESLSQLQYAAKATNVPFAALSGALDTLERNLVQASEGSGRAKQALRDLGVDAAKLAALPLDQQLDVIANKIKLLPTPTDQTAAAMRIFGSAGADLLPILRDGASGIDALRSRADELGITLTGSTAEALKKANEAMTDLSAASHAFWTQILADAAPAIETWEKGALTMEQSIKHMLGSFSSPQDELHYLTTEIVEASNEVAKLGADTGLTGWWDRVGGATKLAADRLEDLRLKVVAVQQQMANAPADPKKAAVPNVDKGLDLDAFARASEKRLDAEQKYYDNINALTQTDVEYTAAAYDEKYADLQLLLGRQQIDYQDYLERVAELNDKFFTPIEVTAKQMGKLSKQVYSDMENYAKIGAQSIQSDFSTFLEDPSVSSFKHMGVAWLQTIEKMVADAATSDLFGALFHGGNSKSGGLEGIFGTILSSIFSGGGGGAAPALQDVDVNALDFMSVPGQKNGGSFDVGGSGGTDSQLVQFKATPGEHVQVGGGGSGGGDVYITNNVTVTSPQVTKADVISAMKQTQDASVAKIQDMRRRGRF